MNDPENKQPPSQTTLHLAYAQASVMILECLMQLLIDRKVIGIDEVIEAFDTAIETKRVLAAEHDHPEIARVAAGVLATMMNSLAAGSQPASAGRRALTSDE
jgi:hypothetical protein